MKTNFFFAVGRRMSGSNFLHSSARPLQIKSGISRGSHEIITLILALVFLIYSMEIFAQCTPNTIVFLGGQPIFNTACGNNSYQTIDGSVPSPPNGNQTFQWEYSLNGNAYVLISSTGVDLPKSDITDLILAPNGYSTGNYAIRRIVRDVSPACDLTSDPVFLYYAQNSSQTSGGNITPLSSTYCFTADGTLTLQLHTGPIHRWELSFNEGAWQEISNTTNIFNYSLNITGTHCYRALIDDVCSGAVGSIDLANDDYSGEACVEVVSQPPVITACAVARTFSGCSTLVITNPAFSETVTGTTLGVFTGSPNNGLVSSNCGVSTTTYSDAVISNGCPIEVTRTWTISDIVGNTSTCNQLIYVQDITPPSINPASSNQTVECDGNGNTESLNLWLEAYGGATASDACSSVGWTHDFNALSDLCGVTGSRTVHFTATDACGNASTTTATFTIEDTTDPAITTSAVSATVQCDGAGNASDLATFLNTKGGAIASDVCSGVTWTNDFAGLSDLCGATGSSTIHFTATDACGNASTTTATFTIEDITDPDITTAAENITVQCDGAGNAAELATFLNTKGGAIASDVCSGVTWTNDFTALSDLCGATGSSTVHFTATDACGNASTTTATFTIVDNTAPSITTGAVNTTVQCDGSGNPSALAAFLSTKGGAIASDQCSGVTWTNDFTSLSDLCGATGSSTVHFTATDACGNASTTTATFTIVDTTVPAITTHAGNMTVECDGAGNSSSLAAFLNTQGGAIASDVCSGVTWTHDFASLSDLCGSTGNATVHFTVTDDCGNASTTTATFTIEDTTDPLIGTGATSVTVECDGAGNSAALTTFLNTKGGATASDVCSGMTWTNDFTALSDLCGATGSATVHFTVTDACGNASTTTATFTIEDTTDPAITTSAVGTTVQCDGAGNASDLAAFLSAKGGATASDVCSGVTWTNDLAGLSDLCGCATGSSTVHFTVTDACGNASTTTATFTIEDITDPDITTAAENITVQCDGAGNAAELATFLNTKGGAIASDVCSGVTWTNDFTALSDLCGATGSSTVHFTATDACGNASTTTATFTIVDNTAPSITTGAVNTTVQCDGSGNASALAAFLSTKGGAIASDQCSGVTWTNDFTSLSDLCGATGSSTVHFTATDACGNASTTTATFTIVDTTVPAITASAGNMTVECDGAGNSSSLAAFLNTQGGAIASDVCSGVTWTHDFASLSDLCGSTGSATVHFTVTDDCGNASTTTATFTIEDTTDPLIGTSATSVTVECDGAGNSAALTTFLNTKGGATASDVCSGMTWTNDFTALSDLCGATGSATVHFTVTDACGNASTTTATFIIEDTTDPAITTSAVSTTVQCDGAGNASDLATFLSTKGGATASDVCSGVTWTNDFTGLSDLCGATGSSTVHFTVTDACGNASTTTATFTIVDTTRPLITTNAVNTTVQCDGAGNTAELTTFLNTKGGAIAGDVCSGVTWTNDFTALSDLCGATGSRVVHFTATDACGNASTTTATFTIMDNTAPSITTGAVNTTVQCDGAGNSAALATFLSTKGGAIASDQCSGVTWTNDFTSLSDLCGATGTRTVHFTATDACGNASTTTASFTIVDTSPPVITTAASNSTVQCGGNNAASLTAWLNSRGGAVSSDICGGVTWSYTPNPANLSDLCGATGTVLVHFTATDACGNASTTSATFTVVDTSPPSISPSASNTTVQCNGSGNATQLTAWLSSRGGASATDGCSGVTWSNDFVSLSDGCGATGNALVHFTATDACGNASTTTATFTIVDVTGPSIVVPNSPNSIECPGTLDFPSPTISDACDSGPALSFSDITTSGICPQEYSVTRTWIATDVCGNSTMASRTISVTDNTPPAMTCPASISISKDASCDYNADPLLTGQPDAMDNCDSNPSLAYADFSCFGNDINISMNHGQGYYFPVTVSGFDDLQASQLKKIQMQFYTNHGKGNVEFILIAPSGDGIVLVGPYCNGGNCEVNTGTTYVPTFYRNASGYTVWENDNFIAPGDGQFRPFGGGSENIITGFNGNFRTSFEELSGPMNGNWILFGRKDGTSTGTILFQGFCLEPSSCDNHDLIVRRWTATDDCGNASQPCFQTIHVRDDSPPVIAPLPAPQNINCFETPELATTTAADACDAEPVLIFNDVTIQGECIYEYTVKRTWTATDICNNTSMATQMISVVCDQVPDAGNIDGESPLCIGTSNQYTSSGDAGGVWSSTNPSVATVNAVTGLVSALIPGVTEITYTVDSPCNGTSSVSMTLNVVPLLVLNNNNTGPGSLRDIISCAPDGSVITFDASLSGQTIILTSGEITINKNLTIIGPGMNNLSLSGNNSSRIFHLLPGYELELENMSLKNSMAMIHGGAMYIEGDLILENVIFQNNFENLIPRSMSTAATATVEVIGDVEIRN